MRKRKDARFTRLEVKDETPGEGSSSAFQLESTRFDSGEVPEGKDELAREATETCFLKEKDILVRSTIKSKKCSLEVSTTSYKPFREKITANKSLHCDI